MLDQQSWIMGVGWNLGMVSCCQHYSSKLPKMSLSRASPVPRQANDYLIKRLCNNHCAIVYQRKCNISKICNIFEAKLLANLKKRAEAEAGACTGKMDIAKAAKAAGLDAIHDTVHEMAKDEARHGRGFEGLLKRYFGE